MMANHFSTRGKDKVKGTLKPNPKHPSRSKQALISDASATITDRADFKADDIMLGSGLKTLSIAASAATFGSYEYRVINFIFDRGIESGTHIFEPGGAGPIRGLSYVEFAVVGGNEIYYNCEGNSGSLTLDIIDHAYYIREFTFTAQDSEQKNITLTGHVSVSSSLCDCT